MKIFLPVCFLLLALGMSSCSTRNRITRSLEFNYPTPAETGKGLDFIKAKAPKSRHFVVKTTAYTHLEADSLPYGKKNAIGTTLKSAGELRSAAADWSRFPLGTKFRIMGQSQVYVVEDYGSALVGTDTIDIYQPCMSTMRSWGAPILGIEVLEWGSVEKSMKILQERAHAASHVRRMLESIQKEQRIGPRGDFDPHRSGRA